MMLKTRVWSGHGCRAFAVLLLTACGAEPALVDESTCLPQEVFRIDRVDLPANNEDARNYARDVGGDQVADNWLGSVNATLSMMFDIPFSSVASGRLRTDVVWMVGVRRCGDKVIVNTTEGAPSGAEVQMIGDADASPLVASTNGEDRGVLPLGTLFDPVGTRGPSFVSAVFAEISIDAASSSDTLHATLAMALPHPEASEIVLSVMTPYIIDQGEVGNAVMLSYFDTTPQDGHITADEIRTSDITESLLAPDIEANGGPASSIGLRIHATRVP